MPIATITGGDLALVAAASAFAGTALAQFGSFWIARAQRRHDRDERAADRRHDRALKAHEEQRVAYAQLYALTVRMRGWYHATIAIIDGYEFEGNLGELDVWHLERTFRADVADRFGAMFPLISPGVSEILDRFMDLARTEGMFTPDGGRNRAKLVADLHALDVLARELRTAMYRELVTDWIG